MIIDKGAVRLALAALVLAIGMPARADTTQTFSRDGYQLTVIDKDSGIPPQTQRKLVNTFFAVYPRMAADFNPAATHQVTFIYDPADTANAAVTLIDRVTFSASYMIGHPRDTDVVTHEVMHVVQAYRQRNIPGWLVEGIADYARYRYGIDNYGWSLTPYRAGQSYTDSYRTTARFLAWLENRHAGLVEELDATLRASGYRPDLWNSLGDASLDDLWNSYAEDPEL